MADWQPPEGHPISPDRAKELMAGDLGDQYREILAGPCLPIYWHPTGGNPTSVIDNGTVTVVKPCDTVFGITAAHVVRDYEMRVDSECITLRLWDQVMPRLEVIDVSEKYDLATFAIEPHVLNRIAEKRNFPLVPLGHWPPKSPQEGRGIMFGGYPGAARCGHDDGTVEWGFFPCIGVARRGLEDQITWLIEPDWGLEGSEVPSRFGGISGGPVIGWFESPSYISHFALSGIISEAHDEFGNVVAITADRINDDGTIDH